MTEDQTRCDLWLDSSKQSRKKRRATFRFDESDATEKLIKKLYDIFSSFGVHGHLSFPASAGEVFQSAGENMVRISTDRKLSFEVFGLMLKMIDLSCLAILKKLEPLIAREEVALQKEYHHFRSSYSEASKAFAEFIAANHLQRA